MARTSPETYKALRYFSTPEGIYLREQFMQYAGSVVLSIGVVMVSFYFHNLVAIEPLLVLLIPVILSGWYGTNRTGILSLGVVSAGYVYYFFPISQFRTGFEVTNIFPLLLFILLGSWIVFLLNKAKKTDEVSQYKRKHLEFIDLIKQEQTRNRQAQLEIKARDEFLSIASHELKTPLTLSLLQIQRALHNIRNVSLANFSVQKLMDMLESVEQQTDRLSKMISDLSNVSLITTGRMKLEAAEFDMAQTVKDIVQHVKMSMRKKDYPITVDVPDSLVVIFDKVRIEQVITNLITNAIKYGNNKPIEVKLEKKGITVRLTVKDKGLGIPKHMQAKIFGRFERGNGHNEIKGLGVGLYITNQIISAHEGKINLKSKPGSGSEFSIELPAKK